MWFPVTEIGFFEFITVASVIVSIGGLIYSTRQGNKGISAIARLLSKGLKSNSDGLHEACDLARCLGESFELLTKELRNIETLRKYK